MKYLLLLIIFTPISLFAQDSTYIQDFETPGSCVNNPCPNGWNPTGYTCNFSNCKYFNYGCISSSTGGTAVGSLAGFTGNYIYKDAGVATRDVLLPKQYMYSGEASDISFEFTKYSNISQQVSVELQIDEPGPPISFTSLGLQTFSSSYGTWEIFSRTYTAVNTGEAQIRILLYSSGNPQRPLLDDIIVSNFRFTDTKCEEPLSVVVLPLIPDNNQIITNNSNTFYKIMYQNRIIFKLNDIKKICLFTIDGKIVYKDYFKKTYRIKKQYPGVYLIRIEKENSVIFKIIRLD